VLLCAKYVLPFFLTLCDTPKNGLGYRPGAGPSIISTSQHPPFNPLHTIYEWLNGGRKNAWRTGIRQATDS
jgi:hypothetical protein